MAYFFGTPVLELPPGSDAAISPEFSLLVLGTAEDGPFGDAYYFNDSSIASRAWGGTQVARIYPRSTDTSYTYPRYFFPDDLSLTSDTSSLYTCSSGTPYRFTGLSTFQTSTTGVSFDTFGSDPSILNQLYNSYIPSSTGNVFPSGGGIFLQTTSLYGLDARTSYDSIGSIKSSNLRLPLVSTLQEVVDSSWRIAAQRVGSSWLPAPASVTVTISGSATTSTGSITVTALNTGTADAFDRYTPGGIIITPQALIFDPGFDGLPSQYRIYKYSNYPTWESLIQATAADADLGILSCAIVSYTFSSGTGQSPSSFFNLGDSPIYGRLGYTTAVGTVPNLTTSSGWLQTLQQEDPIYEQFGFILLAGLSGEALLSDLTSSIALLSLFQEPEDSTQEQGLYGSLILTVPWTFNPDTCQTSYSAIAASGNALLTGLGPKLSRRLLLVHGTFDQEGLPDLLTPAGNNVRPPVPCAYAAVSAIIRESVQEGNPGRPTLLSRNLDYQNTFAIKNGYVQPCKPSNTDLSTLSATGINPVTLSAGEILTLKGPLTLLDGTSLTRVLLITYLKSFTASEMDQYLGQPNSDKTRSAITNSLNSITQIILSHIVPITSFVNDITLHLESDPVGAFGEIFITGHVSLYGETRAVKFQTYVSIS